MRNLKKYLALLVVVAMMAIATLPVFAADEETTSLSYAYENEADLLYQLGLYEGISGDEFVPDLGSPVTRSQGIVMLVRMLGQTAAADALTADAVTATLSGFADAAKVEDWAAKSWALAITAGYVEGTPEKNLNPAMQMKGKDLCTLILRVLGYTPDWNTAAAELADVGGLTAVEAVGFNDKLLIRDDLVGIIYGSLNAEDNNGLTVIARLVAAGVVDKEVAVDAGLIDFTQANAEAAVAAYEAAPITTLDEITAAEALLGPASGAAAVIEDAGVRAAFETRIADKKELTAEAKTEFKIAAYEAAPVTTLVEVAAAEALLAPANTAVVFVKDATIKAAFDARIATKKTAIADARTLLEKLVVGSVSPVPNNKIKVTLTEKANAADKSKFSVTDAAGAAVAITDSTLAADGMSVTLTTAGLTAYAKYSVTVGGVTKSFVGIPVDTTAPTAQVTNDTNTTAKVIFTDASALDAASAQNLANYTIDSGSITAATLNGNTVTLTTSTQVVGTVYKVTVKNVADVAGNVMGTMDGYFAGMAASTPASIAALVAPAIGAINNADYNKLIITFTQALKDDTATNIANYAITYNGGTLAINSATLSADKKVVTLNTAGQEIPKVYTLTISTGVKTSEGGCLASAATYLFAARAKDMAKPSTSAAQIEVKYINVINITFTSSVALDPVTATNVANYPITGLTVNSATLSGNVVTLNTANQTVNQVYKLSVKNVQTVNGQAMDALAPDYYFLGIATVPAAPVADTTAPTIVSATPSFGTVTLLFNEALNAATANDAVNYSIDGGLGYPISAALQADNKTVILTTSAQTVGTTYNVTVTGVKDTAGNAITSASKSFVGVATVKYLAATIVNNNTIDLTFDQQLSDAAIATMTVTIPGVTVSAKYAAIQSNKKVVRVQFRTVAETNPNLFVQGSIYTAIVSDVTNLETASAANNNNSKLFGGTNSTNAIPEVSGIVAVDATTLKVYFSETIDTAAIVLANFTVNGVVPAGKKVISATEIDLYYTTAANTVGTLYDFVVNANAFVDKLGTPGKTGTYKYAGTSATNAGPVLANAIAADNKTINIFYSEDVSAAGVYTIEVSTDGIAYAAFDPGAVVYAVSGNKVTMTITNALTAGKIYKITETTGATDLAGVVQVTLGNTTFGGK